MKICIIADAGKEIGYGHYFRSKRIIELIGSKRDVKATWITRSTFISQKESNSLLISEKYNLGKKYTKNQIKAITQAIKRFKPNLLLIDSYSFQQTHEKELRTHFEEMPLALVCDSPLLKHAGDLIIDSNYYQDQTRAEQIYKSNNSVENARYIIGPYSIPPKTDPLKSSNDKKQILIYWGSADYDGQLLSKTLTAINKNTYFAKIHGAIYVYISETVKTIRTTKKIWKGQYLGISERPHKLNSGIKLFYWRSREHNLGYFILQ